MAINNITSRHTCVACEAGKFRNDYTSDVCSPCSTCPLQDQRITEACTATSDTVCGACQSNSNLPVGEDMHTFCNCNAGYEANETNDECVACGVGKYRNTNTNNSIVCETCEVGKFTTETATAVCSTCSSICPIDFFYVTTECTPTSDIRCSLCTMCGPGYYSWSIDSSTTDTTCGPTINNNRNDTTCAICDANHYCKTATKLTSYSSTYISIDNSLYSDNSNSIIGLVPGSTSAFWYVRQKPTYNNNIFYRDLSAGTTIDYTDTISCVTKPYDVDVNPANADEVYFLHHGSTAPEISKYVVTSDTCSSLTVLTTASKHSIFRQAINKDGNYILVWWSSASGMTSNNVQEFDMSGNSLWHLNFERYSSNGLTVY